MKKRVLVPSAGLTLVGASVLTIFACGTHKKSADSNPPQLTPDQQQQTEEQINALMLVANCTGVDMADVDADATVTKDAAAKWCDYAGQAAFPKGVQPNADPITDETK